MGLLDRAADKPESIKAPATNLTLGSAGAATIATLVAAFNESFESIFGNDAGPNIKAAVLIAIIAAWTLIAVADIIGRAIAKAATERASGMERAAKASVPPSAEPVLLPKPQVAKRLKGADEGGYLGVAVRNGENGDGAVMLVKADKPPEWLQRDEVEIVE